MAPHTLVFLFGMAVLAVVQVLTHLVTRAR
jgi:hypothetical protein